MVGPIVGSFGRSRFERYIASSATRSSVRPSCPSAGETLYPPLGIPGAVGLRLFKPIMRKVFERDLRLLKQLVEKARAEGVQ